MNHTLTADEWAWIKETGERIDSKNPGHVDEEEFYRFINASVRHFGLCHLAEEDRREERRDERREERN
jgi:hypothetical protein